MVDMKGLRERVGLKTMEVAIRLNKSEATVRFWESGRSIPTFDPREIPCVLEVYQCTLDELIAAVDETDKKRSEKGVAKKIQP